MTQNERVYAFFCRPEVAGDVVSSENVKTIVGYVALNFRAANLAVSWKIKISDLRNALTTAGTMEPHFLGQGAKMSYRLYKKQLMP